VRRRTSPSHADQHGDGQSHRAAAACLRSLGAGRAFDRVTIEAAENTSTRGRDNKGGVELERRVFRRGADPGDGASSITAEKLSCCARLPRAPLIENSSVRSGLAPRAAASAIPFSDSRSPRTPRNCSNEVVSRAAPRTVGLAAGRATETSEPRVRVASIGSERRPGPRRWIMPPPRRRASSDGACQARGRRRRRKARAAKTRGGAGEVRLAMVCYPGLIIWLRRGFGPRLQAPPTAKVTRAFRVKRPW